MYLFHSEKGDRNQKVFQFPVQTSMKKYKEYLISGLDWDWFDSNHAVFKHPNMSPRERKDFLIELQDDTDIHNKDSPMSYITS